MHIPLFVAIYAQCGPCFCQKASPCQTRHGTHGVGLWDLWTPVRIPRFVLVLVLLCSTRIGSDHGLWSTQTCFARWRRAVQTVRTILNEMKMMMHLGLGVTTGATAEDLRYQSLPLAWLRPLQFSLESFNLHASLPMLHLKQHLDRNKINPDRKHTEIQTTDKDKQRSQNRARKLPVTVLS